MLVVVLQVREFHSGLASLTIDDAGSRFMTKKAKRRSKIIFASKK